MPDKNRQWVLKSRPHGMVSVDDFEYREVDIPTTLLRLFAGKNDGKQLLKIADPANLSA